MLAGEWSARRYSSEVSKDANKRNPEKDRTVLSKKKVKLYSIET